MALPLRELVAADFVIQVNLPGMDMSRSEAYQQAMEAGYEVTRKALPPLKEALDAVI